MHPSASKSWRQTVLILLAFAMSLQAGYVGSLSSA